MILPVPWSIAALLVALVAALPASAAEASPRDPAAEALVEHVLERRMARADSVLARLVSWAGSTTLDDALAARIDLLESGRGTADLADRLVRAAAAHALAGDENLQAFPEADGLLAAAAALSQDVLTRIHRDPHGLDLSLDSLRTLGDPDRLPPPGGLPTVVAPTPSPGGRLPRRVVLERAPVAVLEPDGGLVDWYAWIPGRDRIYARVGDALMELSPDGEGGRELGLRSPPEAPPPTMSATGEYLAAVDGAGRIRVYRLDREDEGWRTVGPRARVTALALSPVGPDIAWADTSGAVRITNLRDGSTRTLGRSDLRVTALHLSPRADAVAWDGVDDEGMVRRWAGVVPVREGTPVPPPPGAGGLQLAGPPQWAPDGESALGVGSMGGRRGLWIWGDDHLSLLAELDVAERTGQAVGPSFRRIALFLAGEDHPQPWGAARTAPFTFLPSRLWSLEMDWPDQRKGRRLVYDRVVHRDPELSWSPDGEWLVGNLEERAERLSGPDAPLARAGLWAVHLPSGDVVPVTHEPGVYVHPRLNWDETWLILLAVEEPASAGRPARGRLLSRRLLAASPNRRESQRAFLRSRPMVRDGRIVEAAAALRDAVRLDPDNADVRRELAALYMDEVDVAAGAAANGTLLAGAVEERLRLHERDPGWLEVRRELALAFLGYAAAAGRVYSAEAVRRADTFLRADPQRETHPDRVLGILQPALVDAVLWDRANPDAWSLLEDGLRAYRDRLPATGP